MLLGPSLAVSAVLFALGVAGVLLRRNAIVIFMCVELMLNAVNLTFVALAQSLGVAGQIFVFFVMAVAAAEAAVGLAIILARSEEHTSELQSLRHLVCRLLLEKKKTKNEPRIPIVNNESVSPKQ